MLDLTKPVETIHGEKVKILYINKKGDYPVVALVGENEALMALTIDGKNNIKEDLPYLVNVPEKRTVWIKEYTNGECCIFEKKPDLGCTRSLVKLTFTSGQIDE